MKKLGGRQPTRRQLKSYNSMVCKFHGRPYGPKTTLHTGGVASSILAAPTIFSVT